MLTVANQFDCPTEESAAMPITTVAIAPRSHRQRENLSRVRPGAPGVPCGLECVGGERDAPDRWDLPDDDLTVRSLQERLDVHQDNG
jgi:hypothetical protein